MKINYFILIILLLAGVNLSSAQLTHMNKGVSRSEGSVSNGKLVNGYRLPYRGPNYKYFSWANYYILGRAWVHSSLHDILVESYDEMSTYYPGCKFRIMECSKRGGGKLFPHRTHQNGTSVDFMMPLKKGDEVVRKYDRIGMWRYLMKFDSKGRKRFNKSIEIDFDKMARHILSLERVARKRGWRIKKVILETNLKDELFSSRYSKELKKSGIYFVRHLPKMIDEAHDDHYHVDFERK